MKIREVLPRIYGYGAILDKIDELKIKTICIDTEIKNINDDIEIKNIKKISDLYGNNSEMNSRIIDLENSISRRNNATNALQERCNASFIKIYDSRTRLDNLYNKIINKDNIEKEIEKERLNIQKIEAEKHDIIYDYEEIYDTEFNNKIVSKTIDILKKCNSGIFSKIETLFGGDKDQNNENYNKIIPKTFLQDMKTCVDYELPKSLYHNLELYVKRNGKNKDCLKFNSNNYTITRVLDSDFGR